MLPAIILSGIPDYAADLAAGKHTLPVRLGPRAAVRIAQAATVLAAGFAVAWQGLDVACGCFSGIGLIVLPHALLLVLLLERYLRREPRRARIDGLMVLSLLYIVWFAAVPLWRLSLGAASG